MGKLDGKVAIVTGSGQGIGRGLALALAKEGAALVITDINPQTSDAVAKELTELGLRAISAPCDVSVESQVNAMVQRGVDEFGTIDILINNAQALHTAYFPIEDMTEEWFDRSLNSGLKGTWYACRAVFPYMKQHGGKIINFASGWGIVGAPGWSDYAATKEAIRAFTRSAAREWGRYKINVNVICPGLASPAAQAFVDLETEKATLSPTGVTEDAVQSVSNGGGNALGRFGDPEIDGGPVAVFLSSTDSDYMTGQTFHVDGGGVIYA